METVTNDHVFLCDDGPLTESQAEILRILDLERLASDASLSRFIKIQQSVGVLESVDCEVISKRVQWEDTLSFIAVQILTQFAEDHEVRKSESLH